MRSVCVVFGKESKVFVSFVFAVGLPFTCAQILAARRSTRPRETVHVRQQTSIEHTVSSSSSCQLPVLERYAFQFLPLRSTDNEPRTHDLGSFNHRCPRCHALHWTLERREKSSQMEPEFGDCCLDGKIKIDFLHNLPNQLKALYEGSDRCAKEFRENARNYNKAFAFTSTGGEGHRIRFGRSPPFYKIQGEVFHRIGSLMPEENRTPVYSQLFIYDHKQALRYRKNRNPDRNPKTMNTLQTVLENENPLVRVYKYAHDLASKSSMPDFHLQLNFLPTTDRHRYNEPTTSNELAAIIPGDVDSCVNARDVVVRLKGGPLLRVSECNPAYIPWHFPLLAPTGQMGWNTDLRYSVAPTDRNCAGR